MGSVLMKPGSDQSLNQMPTRPGQDQTWVEISRSIEPVCEVQNRPDGQSVLRIYGPIGRFYGVSAERVAREMDRVKGNRLLVRINSPGGNASDGMAIYNLFRSYDGEVTTRVDGVAGSAAGLVFLGGDKRVVPRDGATVMLHESRTFDFVVGTAKNIMEKAKRLETALTAFDEQFVAILQNVADMSEAEAAKVLAAETWYSPKKAIAAKIATEYATEKEKPEKAPQAFSELLAAWGYTGFDAAAAESNLEIFGKQEKESPAGQTKAEPNPLTSLYLARLRMSLHPETYIRSQQ